MDQPAFAPKDADNLSSPARPARIIVSTYAYNENVKIEAVIKRIYDADLERQMPGTRIEVVVVDDGSSDGFPSKLQKQYGFTLIANEGNKGIGYSIRRVIRHGMESASDILVIMAGNNKDDPAEIPRLARPVLDNKADFVQGSRYLSGGKFGAMPLYRRIATQYVHPIVTALVTGKLLRDTTNGFRAMRLSVFSDPIWHLNQEWLDQYGMEYYLLYYFLRRYRYVEVPVTKIYPPKKLGYTKIAPLRGWWDILRPLVYLGLGIKK